jgi:hypothetical protein
VGGWGGGEAERQAEREGREGECGVWKGFHGERIIAEAVGGSVELGAGGLVAG